MLEEKIPERGVEAYIDKIRFQLHGLYYLLGQLRTCDGAGLRRCINVSQGVIFDDSVTDRFEAIFVVEDYIDSLHKMMSNVTGGNRHLMSNLN